MQLTRAPQMQAGQRLSLRQAPPAISTRRYATTVQHNVQKDDHHHRADRIREIGTKFVDTWMAASTKGVDDDVKSRLHELLDSSATFKGSFSLDIMKAQGWDNVVQQLQQEKLRLGHDVYDVKQVFDAVNLDSDTFFCLVEFKYKDKALEGATREHVGYQLLRLGLLLDDTAARVTDVEQRGQVTAKDIKSLSANKAWRPSQFPTERLQRAPMQFDATKAKEVTQSWIKARSSGESAQALLEPILAPNFRLWDAFGALTATEDAPRGQDNSVVGREELPRLMGQLKERYDITCHRIDSAVAPGLNAGFTQWRSHVSNRNSQEKYDIEGLEADLFDEQGRLTDVFLFRDPMDFERQLMQEWQGPTSQVREVSK